MSDTIAFLAGKRCLVLDDEYLIAVDVQLILETAGAAAVTNVSSAADALEMLAAGSSFDLAVLDIKLASGGGGMTIAAFLSKQGTPFVFLTGLQSDEIEAGPFAETPVVQKPYQAAMLVEAIRRVLTKK